MSRPRAPARILVTGNAGAGKTTLARRLGEHLGREVTGLDGVVWGPGWTKPLRAEVDAAVAAIAARPRWVVDGVSRTLWQAADRVLFLDVPWPRALARALLRGLRKPLRTRPGLPPRCPEYRILSHLPGLTWRYAREVRARMLADAAGWPPGKLVVLEDHVAAERYLADL